MSDDYTPTTEDVRGAWHAWNDGQADDHPRKPSWTNEEFDRWHANERADAVMGFATHYLPHDLWVKAKQYADDIREGNA